MWTFENLRDRGIADWLWHLRDSPGVIAVTDPHAAPNGDLVVSVTRETGSTVQCLTPEMQHAIGKAEVGKEMEWQGICEEWHQKRGRDPQSGSDRHGYMYGFHKRQRLELKQMYDSIPGRSLRSCRCC